METGRVLSDSPTQSAMTAIIRKLGLTANRLRIKQLWTRLSLDRTTCKQAVRWAIPPFILVCLIQSTSWVNYFEIDCYLAAIIAACAIPSYPRAKFIKFNVQVTFGFVIAYAYTLFAGWCGVKARQHTASGVAVETTYNSSAEAVVALFFVFFMWFMFTLRSAYPAQAYTFLIPGIIPLAVLPSLGRAPEFHTVVSRSSLTLEAFLAGQAIGIVSGLLVFPQSSRTIFMADFRRCMQSLALVIQTHQNCMTELEHAHTSSSFQKLKSVTHEFVVYAQKIQVNLADAKSEFGWSQFDQDDLESLASLLQRLIPPIIGLTTIANLFELIESGIVLDNQSETTGVVVDKPDHEEQVREGLSHEDGHDQQRMQALLHKRFRDLSSNINGGVQHVQLRMQLTTVQNRTDCQVENAEDDTQNVGNAGFLDFYHKILDTSQSPVEDQDYTSIETLLNHFIKARPKAINTTATTLHPDTLRYLILLYVSPKCFEILQFIDLVQAHPLLMFTAKEFRHLILFVEEKHTRPKRMIIPRFETVLSWFGGSSLLKQHKSQDSTKVKTSSRHPPGSKNPDHLPPTNTVERLGDRTRSIAAVFHSKHAAFGLRGVCCMMSVAIIAFLKSSCDFYDQQRLLWALFAVQFSFSRTAGASTFSLLLRVLGTTSSMVASYVIWYLPYQKTAGVLVFLWCWCCVIGFLCESDLFSLMTRSGILNHLVVVRYPRYFTSWFVALLAAIVMVGNELQVRNLGADKVKALNQAIYPPYILFPFRLSVVLLGVFVAYFWTIFPYPLSEHRELRKGIASILYILANYHASAQRIVLVDLQAGSREQLSSQLHRLLLKTKRLSNMIQTSLGTLDWELNIGGRFPKQKYTQILAITDRLESYISLSAYISGMVAATTEADNLSQWSAQHLSSIQGHLCVEGIPLRLVLLYSALVNGHPLPPGMQDFSLPSLQSFLAVEFPTDKACVLYTLIRSVNFYSVREINNLTELVYDLVGNLQLDDFGPHPIDVEKLER